MNLYIAAGHPPRRDQRGESLSPLETPSAKEAAASGRGIPNNLQHHPKHSNFW